jgi:hypothetical protein
MLIDARVASCNRVTTLSMDDIKMRLFRPSLFSGRKARSRLRVDEGRAEVKGKCQKKREVQIEV